MTNTYSGELIYSLFSYLYNTEVGDDYINFENYLSMEQGTMPYPDLSIHVKPFNILRTRKEISKITAVDINRYNLIHECIDKDNIEKPSAISIIKRYDTLALARDVNQKNIIINEDKIGSKELLDDILKLKEDSIFIDDYLYKALHVDFNYDTAKDWFNACVKAAFAKDFNDMYSFLASIRDKKLQRLNQLYKETRLGSLEEEVRRISATIQSQLQHLKDLYAELDSAKMHRVYAETEEDNTLSRVLNFLDKHKYIKAYEISRVNYTMVIRITTKIMPVQFTYNDSMANKIINENVSLNKVSKSFLYDALTDRTRFNMCITPYEIVLNVNLGAAKPSQRLNYDFRISPYKLKSKMKYGNLHWDRFTCKGSYDSVFTECASKMDIAGLVSAIINYLQTINLGDYAGQLWLQNVNLIKNLETGKFFNVQGTTGLTQEIKPDKLEYADILYVESGQSIVGQKED